MLEALATDNPARRIAGIGAATELIADTCDQGRSGSEREGGAVTRSPHALPTQAKLADQCSIPLDIVAVEVIEKPTSLPDEHEQPSTRVVILLVDLQMIRQMIDSRGEECNLHLWRSGVGLVGAVLGNDFSG